MIITCWETISETIRFGAVQNRVYLVDIETCCKMNICLQQSALVKPVASPQKIFFACLKFPQVPEYDYHKLGPLFMGQSPRSPLCRLYQTSATFRRGFYSFSKFWSALRSKRSWNQLRNLLPESGGSKKSIVYFMRLLNLGPGCGSELLQDHVRRLGGGSILAREKRPIGDRFYRHKTCQNPLSPFNVHGLLSSQPARPLAIFAFVVRVFVQEALRDLRLDRLRLLLRLRRSLFALLDGEFINIRSIIIVHCWKIFRSTSPRSVL